MMSNWIFLGLILAIAVIPEGESIICFQCQSINDPECWDLQPNNTAHREKYARHCQDERRANESLPYFCRIIHQKIKDGNGTVRLWRKCGWEPLPTKNKKDCYYYSDGHHEETVCQCFGNYCNSAPSSFTAPHPLGVLSAAAVAAYVVRLVTSGFA